MNAGRPDPLAVIRDPLASPAQVRAAAAALGPAREPPELWASIANDETYPPEHRRACLFVLFRRHVRPGMPLWRIGEMLASPTWLREENVRPFESLHGKLPVTLEPGTQVFAIRPDLPPGNPSTIYLKVSGTGLSAAALTRVLLTGSPDAEDAERTVLEVGDSEVD
jgi:hypothetical protein